MDSPVEALSNGIRDELALFLAVYRLKGATPDFELSMRAALTQIRTRLQALTSEAQSLEADVQVEARD